MAGILLSPTQLGLSMRLFNPDGSEPETSGNGVRCVVAVGLMAKVVTASEILVQTVAGQKGVRVIQKSEKHFRFETDMGIPHIETLHATMLPQHCDHDATIMNVGNPQCAIFVSEFPENWRQNGAEAVCHERFPSGTNVSFVRVLDAHTIEALFYERGAGETKSSGTGSMGAATAAILRGVAQSPVRICTMGRALDLRWQQTVHLEGPTELIASGRFLLET